MVQALVLMLAGMSAVFLFLSLLVFCTSIMSRLVMHFQPEEVAQPSSVLTTQSVSGNSATADLHARRRRTAAIMAALAHHRSRNNSNSE